MKNKGVYIFNLILFLFIIVLKFVFINHYTNYYNIVNAIFWLASLFIFIKIVGIKRDNSIIKSNVTQVVFITILLSILLAYLSGLYFGFLRNAYSLTLGNIIKNIYSLAIMIVAEEYIRGIIINVCVKDKRPFYILTLLYILLDIVILLGPNSTSSMHNLFIFITTLALPIIARNILSSYLTYHISKVPGMILRLFFSLYVYIFPIFPNLGDYVDSLVGIVIPYLIYFVSSVMIYRSSNKRTLPIKKTLWYVNIPLFIVLLFFVALVSGLFRYQIMAIGSGSMEPIIYRGDAIIFKKITTEDEKKTLEKGNVIVFKHNDTFITHRIVEIEEDDNERVYQTKGDNNASIDAFKVYSNDIVGVSRITIKYIGYPSLWLQKLLSN